jgi:hypothetical protein
VKGTRLHELRTACTKDVGTSVFCDGTFIKIWYLYYTGKRYFYLYLIMLPEVTFSVTYFGKTYVTDPTKENIRVTYFLREYRKKR